ncbi:hypothetical protein [Nocardia sp. R7R-8]|uniref:hypothetical protein n=1 Tax=Nocardia sp. R7R-8 TaxID=3459304 RepID=UPI00403E3263
MPLTEEALQSMFDRLKNCCLTCNKDVPDDQIAGYYCNACLDAQPEAYRLFREWLSLAAWKRVLWRNTDSRASERYQIVGVLDLSEWGYNDFDPPTRMDFAVTNEAILSGEDIDLWDARNLATTDPTGRDANGQPCVSFMVIDDEIESLNQLPLGGTWNSYADWLAQRGIDV